MRASCRPRCGTALTASAWRRGAARTWPSRSNAGRIRFPVFRTRILPHQGGNAEINQRYVERLLKFLLWQKGGYRVTIGGDARIAEYLAEGVRAGGRARFRPRH